MAPSALAALALIAATFTLFLVPSLPLMYLVKVAAAALNQTPLDWEGNERRIIAAIDEARREGASIVCMPELCLTGYGCEDAFLSAATLDMAERSLWTIVPHTQGVVVALGMPILFGGRLYDAAALVADGKLLGIVPKQHLAGDGIHYEPRWFKAWPAGAAGEVLLGDKRYPFGDLVFDVNDVQIGFEICEDAWVAHRPGARLSQRGADILLNPSASHFAFAKQEVRRRFVIDGSRAFQVGYVYANLLGNEAGRALYDGGTIIASGGKLIAEGSRFSYADVKLTYGVIDIDETRMAKARMGESLPDVTASALSLAPVRADFTIPKSKPTSLRTTTPDWERHGHVKEEEFARAVSLGLFDYLRKSHSRGYVVSLSGGADSATVATLVAFALRAALAELGPDGVAEKLRYIRDLPVHEEKALIHRLLMCVYQATENSGEITFSAARDVASALGAEFIDWNVQSIVDGYKSIVSQAIGRPLSWKTDDIALQNIQARVRSPGVWFLANLRGALLLSTSNRSEAAVGYATMDGDTSGGLSPIAGIDKAYLRRWLVWMENEGPEGFGPLPALVSVNAQQPTAELRPAENKQTDEADLMPYDLLDAIEKAAIRDRHAPAEALSIVATQFPQYEMRQLAFWIERFYTLWCRNQWKRERYAPSFHLDDENLDPKTWCRFPILSGGYRRELAELRAEQAETTSADE